ncbi:UDP-glucose 4-epimerase [Streptomyces sp. SPB074]|nr:UDP-glucose 4-epimerase [Streptomyces sp. SPB074]
MRDPAAVEEALRGIDAISHQAAMVGLGDGVADAADYVGCNDLGTAVLLAAAARGGVRALVLAGSMVVYGEGRYTCAEHGTVRPGPRAEADLRAGRFEPRCPACGAALAPGLVPEDAPADPRNVYAATKLAQEHLAAAWARATGGSALSLRYHNVYGPGMPRDTPYAGVASFFRSALARGEAPRVFEDGAQRRDFVHVRDIAAANVRALEALAGSAVPPGTLPRTTPAAAPRAPCSPWPAPSPRPAAGPRRASPASTGSATYSTSPPTPRACGASWAGTPKSPSPRASPSSPGNRCAPPRPRRPAADAPEITRPR